MSISRMVIIDNETLNTLIEAADRLAALNNAANESADKLVTVRHEPNSPDFAMAAIVARAALNGP